MLRLLLAALFSSAAFAGSVRYSTKPSIAEVATSNADFSTLVTALKAADLVETVSACNAFWWCSPLTVFAPTNGAFADLDYATNGLVTDLVSKPFYKRHLQKVLHYHIVYGKLLSGHIANRGRLHTLLGEALKTFTHPIRINSSKVVVADIEASNGVVHGIDAVLLPGFIQKTIPEVAGDAKIFNTLLAAAKAAGIADELGSTRGLTLFAPTDAAFSALGQETIDALLADPEKLKSILKYHIVLNAIVFKEDLKSGPVATKNGASIEVKVEKTKTFFYPWSSWWSVTESVVELNGSTKITKADILAQNGIIHVIDKVLLPPSTTTSPEPKKPVPTIAEIVAGDADFSTLVGAVVAADFVELFDDAKDGPFTVFAPTNAAFAELGGTVKDLLKPENKARLQAILKYHVVSGKVTSSDLENGRVSTLLDDQEVDVAVDSGVVLNGDIKVTTADIEASNGVIHVINKVLIPQSDIVETASTVDALSTLVSLVEKAGLVDTLQSQDNDFTVFAPTNEAFAKLPASIIAILTDPKNIDLLKTILTYHVLSAYAPLRNVTAGKVVTVQGESIKVGTDFKLNGSTKIIKTDVFTSNGVVHLIDEVLIPPSVFL